MRAARYASRPIAAVAGRDPTRREGTASGMTVRVPGCGASIFASSSASAMGINALIVALLAGLQRARRRADAAALRSALFAEASSEGEGEGVMFSVRLHLYCVDVG